MNQIKKLFLIFFFPIFIASKYIYVQPIYVNSIMKCGTHLLVKCLELLTHIKGINTYGDKVTSNELPTINENSFLFFHVPFSNKAVEVLEKNNFKGFFIYRDPRDRVVSLAFFILYKRDLTQKSDFIKKKPKIEFADLLTKLISGVTSEYENYLPWMNIPSFCSVKFEDLVGPNGGGVYQNQYDIIKKICDHLQIKYTNETIENCIKNLYGDTWSFREGKIGSWKQYFTEDQKQLFKKKAGELLVKLGYEKDQNW